MRKLLFVAALAGCGSGGATTMVVPGGAVLGAVSYDQSTIASLTAATRQPNGAFFGTLQVTPAAGGAAVTLDASATGGQFARGDTLYYLASPSLVTEGTPPRARVFGVLKAWQAPQSQAVQLGAVVTQMAIAQNGGAVAFVDRAAPSIASPGTVRVWTPSSPTPIAIADNVVTASLDVSDDGRHVLVGIPPRLVLVTLPAGTIEELTTDPKARAPMMTPDGATVAWLEGANNLMIASTSNAAAPTQIVIRTADVEKPTVQNAQMVNAATYVARLKLDSGSVLHVVTATAVTPLAVTDPARFAVVQETPGGSLASNRWLFYATTQDDATGLGDLWALDLMNPAAPGLQLAASTTGNPAFSDDGTHVRWFENEDPLTDSGELWLQSLPAGPKTMIADLARGAAFEPGTTRLLYLADPDATTGAGMLAAYGGSPGGGIDGVLNFAQSRAQAAMYFTAAGEGVFRATPL